MLQMPRRSVTRFFIPLIDVLTLLFCIFLMMPAVKRTAEAGQGDLLDKRQQALDQQARELRLEMGRVRRETTRQVLNNLTPRVLEINGANGNLEYRDPRVPTTPRVIANEPDARELIRRDESGPGGPDSVYYIIRYPLDPNSDYPRSGVPEEYLKWFAGVPLEFEWAGTRIKMGEKGGRP
ncbi:MAG TPA: hypothetical protein VMS17_18840 [Gemmataceae bacterium]|nr:hypothetical protein [Gemmataceae bacterium]